MSQQVHLAQQERNEDSGAYQLAWVCYQGNMIEQFQSLLLGIIQYEK